MAAKPVARDKLDALGIDAICEMIEADMSYQQIAQQVGVGKTRVIEWIHADADRAARARISLIRSANECDAKAEEALLAISDGAQQGEITRQRELASHYRWRAKARDPRTYGDRVAVDADVSVAKMTDEQIQARIAALAAQAGLTLIHSDNTDHCATD